MRRRQGRLALICACLLFCLCVSKQILGQSNEKSQTESALAGLPAVQSLDIQAQSVTATDPTTHQSIHLGLNESVGPWALMAVVHSSSGAPLAVFENVADWRGDMVYVGTGGVVLDLPQSAEATSADPATLYEGHTLQEVMNSKEDILSSGLLKGTADPSYAAVAAAMPPLRVPSFVGTRESDDKPTWEYGGFSDEIYVDVGKVYTQIQEARNKKDVWEGLVGGWLPVLRYVFPSGEHRYWEETIFASEDPGHFWNLPTWFRVLLVEDGKVKQAHYIDTNLPYPPRGEPKGSEFYQALLKVNSDWKSQMKPRMTINVPDPKIMDFCLRSLSLVMITRVGNHLKYGYPPLGGINVFGGYGYNNVDTFQDTFNGDVSAMLEWGLFDTAKGYIDDYFTHAVRDDGSINTRGPEIGQYGKMLSVMAKYYEYTHDAQLMQKYQEKLNAIVNLFYTLRKQSKELPADNISYGLIRAWSEHDSSLKVHPYRFMEPYFSSNLEGARGFADLGQAWIDMGKKLSDPKLQAEGTRLLQESAAMDKDVETAINKSIDRTQSPAYIPPMPVNGPIYGRGRVYVEMLDSGMLPEAQAKMIMANLAANHGSRFGLPGGGMHLTGFLAFGPAYSRLQFDLPRQFLLLYDADMSHIYSPGTWTAVESAKLDGTQGGPYATPSEDTIPVFTKWMLLFEEPETNVLWLAKATPRIWLQEGKAIAISGAPTRFGTVGYQLHSDIDHNKVSAVIHLPANYNATTKLRLRVPEGKTMHSVTVNGRPWTNFSAEGEVITIPPAHMQVVNVEVSY